MELTKEYFDEKLSMLATKEDLIEAVKPLATKDELAEAVKPLATKDGLNESFEELARITAEGFAEAAKQRSIDAIKEELADIRRVIDKIFEQMDKDFEMRALYEKELLGLRARVEKMENTLRMLNIQRAWI